jgi:hypothetical protein
MKPEALIHHLAISSQANPAQPVLSAQRGRRQNRRPLHAGGTK